MKSNYPKSIGRKTINGLKAAIRNKTIPTINLYLLLSISPEIINNTPKKAKTTGNICENNNVPFTGILSLN